MIGFMQGRLSPLVDGKIQAFPWDHWNNEFSIANKYGFNLIEWTLDQKRLYENPLMTEVGQKEIKGLSIKNKISIQSLTGDCFMQAPFYKVRGKNRENILLCYVFCSTSKRFFLNKTYRIKCIMISDFFLEFGAKTMDIGMH